METRIITIESVGRFNATYDRGYSLSISSFPSKPSVGSKYRLTTADAGTKIISIEEV